MAVPLWLNVIGTALALGVVHVLTGPDHLSALSTLSVGKPLKTAFGLGVRWGCGHSFGLLIVAIVFFALGQGIDLTKLSYWADLFVGVFMILLGVWYIMKAFRDRLKYLQEKEDQDIQELLQNQAHPVDLKVNMSIHHDNAYNMNKLNQHDDGSAEEEQIELQEIEHDHDDDHDHDEQQQAPEQNKPADIDSSHDDDANADKEHSEQAKLKSYQNGSGALIQNGHDHNELDNDREDNVHADILKKDDDMIPDDEDVVDLENQSLNPLFDSDDASGRNKCITRVAAFVAGIFHGIAGPGGVLGVMVALKLNDWFLSSLYLILFFLSSIVTMGIYAVVYGYCTQRMTVCANNKQKCAFILKVVSAIFSLFIGILWLSLTFTGQLEKLFA
eukprot:CAMPEP_0197036054 /NCGR_PEP_ID=MMETSP1384-20130603/13668_1 /TAXON_ID=29189 /ORGANISM="Ammonia sp." /LENGTH=386 /DNA_ID=CAMNT_0042466183 /DNA_START=36 /DNA_END=1196 /DNA_ORIENTATION=-